MNLKNINLLDVGKFTASTAVVYISGLLSIAAKIGISHSLQNSNPYQDFEACKFQLGFSALNTAGVYKCVDSVFEFDSVHSKAGMSAAASVIFGPVKHYLHDNTKLCNM